MVNERIQPSVCGGVLQCILYSCMLRYTCTRGARAVLYHASILLAVIGGVDSMSSSQGCKVIDIVPGVQSHRHQFQKLYRINASHTGECISSCRQSRIQTTHRHISSLGLR